MPSQMSTLKKPELTFKEELNSFNQTFEQLGQEIKGNNEEMDRLNDVVFAVELIERLTA
jgi:hypothetical protein